MNIINENRMSFPKQVDTGFVFVTITAVLTEGIAGDQAVYVGVGDPEWVARHGNKQTYKDALVHFPFLKEESYRR